MPTDKKGDQEKEEDPVPRMLCCGRGSPGESHALERKKGKKKKEGAALPIGTGNLRGASLRDALVRLKIKKKRLRSRGAGTRRRGFSIDESPIPLYKRGKKEKRGRADAHSSSLLSSFYTLVKIRRCVLSYQKKRSP